MEKSNVKNARQIFRIQREIRFLKLLHHPHIVKVLEVMETDECIYIVMEYAMGGELFDYLVAHGKLKVRQFYLNFFVTVVVLKLFVVVVALKFYAVVVVSIVFPGINVSNFYKRKMKRVVSSAKC